MGRKNTVGKGEIAHYVQFLLFPQYFQQACFPGASKGVIVWEWVTVVFCKYELSHRSSSVADGIDRRSSCTQFVV